MLLRGQVTEPAFAFACLRGSFAGLIIVAFETLAAHIYVLYLHSSFDLGFYEMFVGLFVSPASLGNAATSFFSTLFPVGAALFDGLIIALVFIGLPRAFFSRQFESSKTWQKAVRIISLSFLWVFTGLHLHLAGYIIPPVGLGIIFLLEGIFLYWLLEWFDVMTVAVAVGTAVFFSINHSLLYFYQVQGNGPQVILFILWALILVSASFVAFRPAIQKQIKRWQTAFE